MAVDKEKKPGKVVWTDLTVRDAAKLRDFYRSVVGWAVSEFDMGSYSDYCMNTKSDGKTVAGICHKKGGNARLPSQWLIYVQVENLDRSMKAAKARGGSIVDGPRPLGSSRFCVVRDPAGAVMALIAA